MPVKSKAKKLTPQPSKVAATRIMMKDTMQKKTTPTDTGSRGSMPKDQSTATAGRKTGQANKDHTGKKQR